MEIILEIIMCCIFIYFVLLMISFTYSCGGWCNDCGICWIAIVQFPLKSIDWIIHKLKRDIK